jgi:hypothetical protein
MIDPDTTPRPVKDSASGEAPAAVDAGTQDGKLQPDRASRVWEHALHEETIYFETSNFFLVAEAMLLVFYATLVSEVSAWVLMVVATLGIFMTGMWWMINIRQESDLETAKGRLKRYCPEYLEYLSEREDNRFRARAGTILSRFIPLVIALLWATLLAYHLIT